LLLGGLILYGPLVSTRYYRSLGQDWARRVPLRTSAIPFRAPLALLVVGEPSSLASLKLARRVLSMLPLALCRKRTPRRDLPIISGLGAALLNRATI